MKIKVISHNLISCFLLCLLVVSSSYAGQNIGAVISGKELDLNALERIFPKNSPKIERGEFETKGEYKTRMTGGLDDKDYYYFDLSHKDKQTKYDMDSNIYKVVFEFSDNPIRGLADCCKKGRLSGDIKSMRAEIANKTISSEVRDSYRYGQIEVVHKKTYAVVFKNLFSYSKKKGIRVEKPSGGYYSPEMIISVNMPVEAAKNFKPSLRLKVELTKNVYDFAKGTHYLDATEYDYANTIIAYGGTPFKLFEDNYYVLATVVEVALFDKATGGLIKYFD